MGKGKSHDEQIAANEQRLLHDLHREVEDQNAHAVVHGDPGERPSGLAATRQRKPWWWEFEHVIKPLRRVKLYRDRNGGTLYLRLRAGDRKYLIVKFWTHTYGPVQR